MLNILDQGEPSGFVSSSGPAREEGATQPAIMSAVPYINQAGTVAEAEFIIASKVFSQTPCRLAL